MTQKYDALIVIGRGFKGKPKELDETPCLGLESRINVLSAGELFNKSLADKLIFTGGQTLGEQYPPEAEEMARYLHRNYPDISPDCIVTEGKSIDTPDNAERVKSILNKHGFGKLGLLATGVHLPRAIKIFRTYGINADGFVSENILAQKSYRHANLVKKYLFSALKIGEEIEEAVLRGINLIDPHGKIPRIISKRIRK